MRLIAEQQYCAYWHPVSPPSGGLSNFIVSLADSRVNDKNKADEKKNLFLAKVETLLAQKIEQTNLITFHWRIV